MARRLSDQCSIGTWEYARITVNKLRKLVSLSPNKASKCHRPDTAYFAVLLEHTVAAAVGLS